MGITIQHNPGTYFSAHGDVLFVVCDIVKASDPVTYPDYRYICDVYIGAILIARLKSYPRPDNKMGVFNVGNIVRGYLSSVFNPSAGQLRAQQMGLGEFFIGATMKFGDEYNFVLNTNLTVDSERTYYNHYNGRLLGILTNLSSLVDKPITARPLTTPISQNANFCFIPYLPTDTDNVTLEIKSYTKAGLLLGTYSTNIAPASANTLQLYNVSRNVINTASPGLIDPVVAGYYTVQFLNPNITGEPIYRFDLICEAKHEIFTVHFLNRYGGFESRDFTKVSRKVIDIEKSEFGKLGYVMDSSGVVTYKNANNVYNETRSVYASQFKEKMTLNTDILTDSEYQWLGDLILSPMSFIEIGGYFIPMSIVSNNYEFKKVINDQLTNLTIEIEFGEQFNAQYR
jgi:hypothetical protein